jgi:hypothetical protein
MRSFRRMVPTERPEPSSKDPVEGHPDVPEPPGPGTADPEPDDFPGYGEPPPDVRRDAPPNVPRRDWGPKDETAP